MDAAEVANFKILAYTAMVMTGLAAAMFVRLVMFVRSSGEKMSLMTYRLLAVSLSLVGLYAAEVPYILCGLVTENTSVSYQILAAQTFFTDSLSLLYIQYSWARSEFVARRVFLRSRKVIAAVISVFPFITYAHCAGATLTSVLITYFGYQLDSLRLLTLVTNLVMVISGLLNVSFDCMLIYAFLRFSNATRINEMDTVDWRFEIIFKYGMLAIGCAFGSLVFYTSSIPFADLFAVHLLVNLAYLCISLGVLTLLAMKFALYAKGLQLGPGKLTSPVIVASDTSGRVFHFELLF
ncbi:hypothetical protein HDU84_006196 [Entophlyctis sp. JEL0112]|nr:hypothetical protein HDU84_006196 [Entophlyctis sp. JEL0112]